MTAHIFFTVSTSPVFVVHFFYLKPYPDVIFFMLNSAERVIFSANKYMYENANNSFNWNSCKQTVKILISIMRRLIWVCTVCLCPKKLTLGFTIVQIIFHFLWDHWAHCGIFENGVLLMYTLEGVSSVINFITAYEESQ